ncbi:DUF4174 domain-containing protein [Luteolibacter sp. AS25]|uniref:DUF4174 domain-containing protein n=1 Tax=Luteolibacter sp. AS25 TaxID=3135776 RepID=UPI00398B852B
MKLGILFFLLTVVPGFSGNKIADFQWKNRLLVVSEADAGFVKAAEKEKAKLEERDLKVFILGGEGMEKFPIGKGLWEEFVAKYPVSADEAKVWLIGKDGKTARQWSLAEFSFEEVFAAIDGMPMRQREMKEKNE